VWAPTQVEAYAAQPQSIPEQDVGLMTQKSSKGSRGSPTVGLLGMMSSQLKLGGAPILQWLTELLNCSLHTGEIPAGWRTGCIISLHKNGTCCDPSNYRGNSILPAMYKLFASLIATRISATVPRHKHPYGFCGQKGTAGASFNFVLAILERLLNKERAYALS
jgi:hypothetical protein